MPSSSCGDGLSSAVERELVLHSREAPSVVSSGSKGKGKRQVATCFQRDEMHPAGDSPPSVSEKWSVLKSPPPCTPETGPLWLLRRADLITRGRDGQLVRSSRRASGGFVLTACGNAVSTSPQTELDGMADRPVLG